MADSRAYRDRLHRSATLTRDLLVRREARRWEIYAKASTLRETARAVSEPAVDISVEETGVAVRTAHHGTSGFAAASGLDTDASRRAVDGAAVAARPLAFDPLPPPHLLGQSQPRRSTAPVPEDAIAALTPSIARAVQQRSGDRLEVRRTVVQEGTYSWILTNAEGYVASHEDSTASILVETALRVETPGLWREWYPLMQGFDCDVVAAQICDRALLETGPVVSRSGLYDVILHSELMAGVITAMTPFFVARPGVDDPLTHLVNRDGQLTGSDLTLVDDRVGQDAPIVAPCDGEGLPATRTLLLDQGVPRHRLACYRDAVVCGEMPRGGAVRLSYRDYPHSGVGCLRVETGHAVSPAALLSDAPRSLYLLRELAPVVIDAQTHECRILASGVWIDKGRIEGRQPVVEVRGSIAQLLRRLDGVGSDLRWHQTPVGLIGASSALIRRQRIG